MLYLFKRCNRVIMKNLKDVLGLKEVQECLKSNLFLNNNQLEEAISNVLITFDYSVMFEYEGKNSVKAPLMFNDKNFSFETALYVNGDKTMYLLESRLFNEETDNMVGAYLQVLNADLSFVDELIDDVWEYADWELAK